ncbi:MAG: EAL domain-containing protein [Formivibrio sp.]|nr:EAL domain-containing protein [Formivibrio sp.]
MACLRVRPFLVILFLIAGWLYSPVWAANQPQVLLLNSYHQGMDWTDGETAGVQAGLAKNIPPVQFHIEYMDTKRVSDQAHFDNLRRLYAHKYQSLKLDAIVATDNDAFEFLRRYRDELFPGVPVVFCGVNWFREDLLTGLHGFTGVAETSDSAATIKLMLHLHPQTKRIVVVIDNTTTGSALRKEMEPILASFKNKVEFTFLDNLTLGELPQKLGTLAQDNLVLLMPFARDQAGTYVTYPEIAQLVTQHSPVPVYANWDFYLGYGIVGGLLTTARAQGEAASEILQLILRGESADAIPVRQHLAGHYAFDNRQLVRFHIPKSQLPESSTFVFQPWHETHQPLIWLGLVLLFALIALLWALLISMARKRQADAVLQETLATLQSHDAALREISQGVLIAGTDQRVTYANHAIERISGYSQEELLGQSYAILQGPKSNADTVAKMRTALDAAQPFQGEILNYRKDGTEFWSELSLSPVFDTSGQLTQFVGVQSDITPRKQADVELRIAAKAFESQVGMLVTDSLGVILRVNQAFIRTTGYSVEEAVGQKSSLLKSGRQDTAFYTHMWASLLEQHFWQGVIWNRHKNGGIYAEWLTIYAVISPEGGITHFVGAFSDITQNKEAEAEIHRLAYYDQLTHLPNRRLLQDRLGQALAAAARDGLYGAVLFLDLDNFNTLNDTRGHDIGDLLLVQVAQRLRLVLRQVDTLARQGGDDFVIILEALSDEAEEAAAVAKNIGHHLRAAIAQPFHINGHECVSAASIGICLFRGDEAPEDLLKNADIAMYQAKAGGRNTSRFFDPQMQSTLDQRSALESDLRQALTRDELQLYYQAQVDGCGHTLGAEVLLRWQHPEHHFVSPADFIPLAEETGLILPIGQWVLERACTQIKSWSDDPIACGLHVSVNVSPLQFRQDYFVAQVQTVLKESGIDPARLKLELTETLVLNDIENTIEKMHALKRLGLNFSMDDFGTGYSSLSYLTRLPLDELKIDKSFVFNLPGNPNDEVIAQTIITMGQRLGLNVIAEGVETEPQRLFLAQHGCHVYQGYLFSRPLPLEAFNALLHSTSHINAHVTLPIA